MKVNKLILLLFIALPFASCSSVKDCKHTKKNFFGQQLSTLVVVKGQEPTCLEPGWTDEIYCSKCDEIISPSEPLDALGHEVVIVPGKPSTCNEKGYSNSEVCVRCNEVLKESFELPYFSHSKGKLLSIDNDNSIHKPQRGLFECSVCHEHFKERLYHNDIGLPILYINGDIAGISKTNVKNITVEYDSEKVCFNSKATLKVQGSSSSQYEKKNFSLTLLQEDGKKNKFELKDGWGKQAKYCLKANYIDSSQARNVLSGRIYSNFVRSWGVKNEISSLVNGGAVDGFPILVCLNDRIHGLYTLNIPKDKWAYGLDGDSSSKQAAIFGGDWTNSVKLRSTTKGVNSNGWELEWASTEDEKNGLDWVTESLNNSIKFINSASDEDFLNHVDEYFDVNSAIDSMILVSFITAWDNTAKNIMYVTYDGKKWFQLPYDLDGTFGLYWDGTSGQSDRAVLNSFYLGNKLWERLFILMHERIMNRVQFLLSNTLDKENLIFRFLEFFNSVPDMIWALETERWPNKPSTYRSTFSYFVNFISHKFEAFKKIQ